MPSRFASGRAISWFASAGGKAQHRPVHIRLRTAVGKTRVQHLDALGDLFQPGKIQFLRVGHQYQQILLFRMEQEEIVDDLLPVFPCDGDRGLEPLISVL